MGKLKIEGYDKFYRVDIGEWRVGKITEEDGAYHIILMSSDGKRKGLVLGRDTKGFDFDGKYYELRDTYGDYIIVHLNHIQTISGFRDIIYNFLNR